MKKIIIIGGGISGLTSGIYARMKGFESIILEKHTISGGECTGWDRKGYHIDGCIHWLIGTKEGTSANKFWKEVGALEGTKSYQPESFLTYDYKGLRICLYRELERLRQHLLDIAPEDSEVIHEFCNDIKNLENSANFNEKPMDLMNPIEIIKSFMAMEAQGKLFKKYGKVTCGAFSRRFKHPGIREMFEFLSPSDNMSIAILMMALGNFASGNAGIPKGGSRAFAHRMENKYLSLGGILKKNYGVQEILIEKGVAKGVLLEDGTTLYGDYVIASCDPKVTFDHLLKGAYFDKNLKRMYENPTDYILASSVYVALGVNASMTNHPRTECLSIPPFSFDNQTVNRLSFTTYNYEPSFAPEGQTVVTVPINIFGKEAYDYWVKLYKDPSQYQLEKQRIGTAIIHGLETHYPELQGKIELLDVATPVTYTRYAGAYQGAYMPFFITTNSKMMFYHNGKIKGLKNCYLSGQWIAIGGGLPGALLTGKETLQRICKKEKIAW